MPEILLLVVSMPVHFGQGLLLHVACRKKVASKFTIKLIVAPLQLSIPILALPRGYLNSAGLTTSKHNM